MMVYAQGEQINSHGFGGSGMTDPDEVQLGKGGEADAFYGPEETRGIPNLESLEPSQIKKSSASRSAD